MPLHRTRVTLAIVGDVHRYWRREDAVHLERRRQDLALFVGDLGDEDVEMVEQVAGLRVPKAVLLGNHDAFRSFSEKRVTEALRRSVELLGDDHLAYGVREVHRGGFSLIGARPFTWGGASLRSPEVYGELCGIRTVEDSARTIVDAARRAEHRDLVVLAHNGPTGLSRAPHDIYGKDFGKPGGDWGDRDLELALERIAELGLRVRCVIAGHMHHKVMHPRGGQRTRFVRRNGTLFVNPAVVPRHREKDGVLLSHFLVMVWQAGELQEMREEWVDENGEVHEVWEPRVKELPAAPRGRS